MVPSQSKMKPDTWLGVGLRGLTLGVALRLALDRRMTHLLALRTLRVILRRARHLVGVRVRVRVRFRVRVRTMVIFRLQHW